MLALPSELINQVDGANEVKKTLAAVVVGVAIAIAIPSFAEEQEPAEKIELKDGSLLFLHDDGTGRMIDQHGKPMRMSDDTPMETSDGRVVMMKNNWIWVRMGPKAPMGRKID